MEDSEMFCCLFRPSTLEQDDQLIIPQQKVQKPNQFYVHRAHPGQEVI